MSLAVEAATTCSGAPLVMGLGTYDGFNTSPTDSSAAFNVTCFRDGGSATTVVTVAIGPSLRTGSVANRAMKHSSASDLLSYNLFRDAGRSLVWGDTQGINTLAQSITQSNRTSRTVTFTIFGRIGPTQDVRVGTYSDQLTITVIF